MDVVWPQPKAPHYAVPNSWNFSRFLSNLIAVETEQGLLSQMLIDLREQRESLFLRKLFWASLPNKRQKSRDR